MKKSRGSGVKYIFLGILLAVLCIGGVELAVCSVKEPEIYTEITAPVRAVVEKVEKEMEKMWESVHSYTTEQVQIFAKWASHTTDKIAQGVTELVNQPESEPEEEFEGQELSQDSELYPIPESAERLTCFIERDGMEYLTGGSWEVVYYNQTDETWAKQPYGRDHIGGYGCGPTSMAMAVSTMTDSMVNPVEMAQWCVTQGHWASRQGSHYTIVSGVAEDYGLRCESVPLEEFGVQDLHQRLASGEIAVALMGKGHFTNRGHYILLRGITLDGKVLVADPASRERTLVAWEPELILEELSTRRHSGAPLWFLSTQRELNLE